MGDVWIALTVMVSAVLIVNLGLGDAIAEVVCKVLKCSLCLSFWATLAVFVYRGSDIVEAVALSIIVSYLSNFFGLILSTINKLYTKLWRLTESRK